MYACSRSSYSPRAVLSSGVMSVCAQAAREVALAGMIASMTPSITPRLAVAALRLVAAHCWLGWLARLVRPVL